MVSHKEQENWCAHFWSIRVLLILYNLEQTLSVDYYTFFFVNFGNPCWASFFSFFGDSSVLRSWSSLSITETLSDGQHLFPCLAVTARVIDEGETCPAEDTGLPYRQQIYKPFNSYSTTLQWSIWPQEVTWSTHATLDVCQWWIKAYSYRFDSCTSVRLTEAVQCSIVSCCWR